MYTCEEIFREEKELVPERYEVQKAEIFALLIKDDEGDKYLIIDRCFKVGRFSYLFPEAKKALRFEPADDVNVGPVVEAFDCFMFDIQFDFFRFFSFFYTLSEHPIWCFCILFS